MTALQLVGGTSTKFAPKKQSYTSATTTESYYLEDAVGRDRTTRLGKDVSDQWQQYAIYQSHVTLLNRTSAVFSRSLLDWKQDTQYVSSLSEIIMHPSYQRIIGLGPTVVPFILHELVENGGHWFWALQALTGENPVSIDDQGRTKKMTAAWINWGRQHSII